MMNESWNVMKLGNLVHFRTGKLDSNAATIDGEYPFFTCSRESFRTDTYSFDTECVLLAGNNANGVFPIKYFSGKFDAYQRTYVIESRDSNRLDIRFLFYALQLKLELLQRVSTGVTTKFLTLAILNNIELQVPSIVVQRKITSILSVYDDHIENNRRRIEILEELARSIYCEWFVHFRFPGHEEIELVNSELGAIPEGWKIIKAGDIYNTTSGGTPSRKKASYFGGSIQWAKTKEVNDGFILQTEENITQEGFRNSSAKLFPKRTVLMALYGYGTLGRLGILSTEMATNQACCAIIPKSKMHSYAYTYLMFREHRERIINLRFGAAQQNINQGHIRNLAILGPPNEVLQNFDKFIIPLFELILTLEKKIRLLLSTRGLLLPQLVSGQIDVSDLKIEIPTDTHQTSKYSVQSSLDQRLDGDDEHDPS